MEKNKCLNCGTLNDVDSKFCVKCGGILKTEDSSNNRLCPYCGSSIPANASKCKNCGEWINKSMKPSNHSLAIVLGYIFTLLGGWIGLIIAVYLLTRDDSRAKKHGGIQLAISIIWIVIILLIWSSAMSSSYYYY
ncbi:double zinc ribbon [Methanobrevibacter cuticularis]|uniref:Double zinc ribbon n=1 Tax=Methanobrevibacter cuticularis TaxID=47311 RepID=A0A166D559_9EURY|nr:zinc ribbon domain-containing protein [Methanobrevibacter cuticularis]KZX15216.1 double zinc ribbon [Methanobrevibacter cuticularis]